MFKKKAIIVTHLIIIVAILLTGCGNKSIQSNNTGTIGTQTVATEQKENTGVNVKNESSPKPTPVKKQINPKEFKRLQDIIDILEGVKKDARDYEYEINQESLPSFTFYNKNGQTTGIIPNNLEPNIILIDEERVLDETWALLHNIIQKGDSENGITNAKVDSIYRNVTDFEPIIAEYMHKVNYLFVKYVSIYSLAVGMLNKQPEINVRVYQNFADYADDTARYFLFTFVKESDNQIRIKYTPSDTNSLTMLYGDSVSEYDTSEEISKYGIAKKYLNFKNNTDKNAMSLIYKGVMSIEQSKAKRAFGKIREDYGADFGTYDIGTLTSPKETISKINTNEYMKYYTDLCGRTKSTSKSNFN